MSTIIEKKIKKDSGRIYTGRTEIYSSANDVVQDLKRRAIRHDIYDMTQKSLDSDFCGVEKYSDALDLLAHGYQPTVEKLKSSLNFTAMGDSKRTSFRNDIHGFAPVVPLAIKGIPNSMINSYTKPMKCKVVDIYYDMGVCAGVSAAKIIEAGQKLLASILALEAQGYRFNLYALQAYSDDSDTDILCVKMKSSNKPLDLKRISFPLTHPAFFRVIGFDWQGRSPITAFRGYGRGRALTDEISTEEADRLIKALYGNNAIYLSCNNIKKKNEAYIKEVLTNGK